MNFPRYPFVVLCCPSNFEILKGYLNLESKMYQTIAPTRYKFQMVLVSYKNNLAFVFNAFLPQKWNLRKIGKKIRKFHSVTHHNFPLPLFCMRRMTWTNYLAWQLTSPAVMINNFHTPIHCILTIHLHAIILIMLESKCVRRKGV